MSFQRKLESRGEVTWILAFARMTDERHCEERSDEAIRPKPGTTDCFARLRRARNDRQKVG
ncbi:MAG: hypothetical protein V1849_02330, partial [Chloroflexota bacterium]